MLARVDSISLRRVLFLCIGKQGKRDVISLFNDAKGKWETEAWLARIVWKNIYFEIGDIDRRQLIFFNLNQVTIDERA